VSRLAPPACALRANRIRPTALTGELFMELSGNAGYAVRRIGAVQCQRSLPLSLLACAANAAGRSVMGVTKAHLALQ